MTYSFIQYYYPTAWFSTNCVATARRFVRQMMGHTIIVCHDDRGDHGSIIMRHGVQASRVPPTEASQMYLVRARRVHGYPILPALPAGLLET